MKTFVFSRGAAEAMAPFEVPHVIVSISSAPEDRARIRENSFLRGLLRLAFVDRDTCVPRSRAEITSWGSCWARGS